MIQQDLKPDMAPKIPYLAGCIHLPRAFRWSAALGTSPQAYSVADGSSYTFLGNVLTIW